jgi:hypothetical protein
MPGFEDMLSAIKTQVTDLAKLQVKDYAVQAADDTNAFLESTKHKLKTWTEQLAAGAIDKEEFLWLLNSQQALGQMKLLTQAGLAQVAIDTFTTGVRKIVTDSLLSLAGKLL